MRIIGLPRKGKYVSCCKKIQKEEKKHKWGKGAGRSSSARIKRKERYWAGRLLQRPRSRPRDKARGGGPLLRREGPEYNDYRKTTKLPRKSQKGTGSGIKSGLFRRGGKLNREPYKGGLCFGEYKRRKENGLQK